MVQFLKRHQLLKRGREAKSVECYECEEHCTRPVESLRNAAGERVYFLLCHLRSDTNRIRIEHSAAVPAGLPALCSCHHSGKESNNKLVDATFKRYVYRKHLQPESNR